MDETSSPSSQSDDTTRRTAVELKWPRQPYPGLRPFEVDDDIDESLVFFGRDRQKDEILRRLNDSHVVFVVGPSGSGKSSLIKAGVIPALKAGLLTKAGHRWRIAQTRPERRPLAQLAEALSELLAGAGGTGAVSDCREAIEDLLREEDSALWVIADSIAEHQAAAGHKQMRTLLLIDQFEEAFGPEIHDPAEVTQFFRILTRFFAKPHKDLYLIIAMRTGYVGSTAAHPDVAEMLNSTAYLTPILTPSQMATAISRPAETYGGAVEPELVQEILDDAAKPREDMADQLPLVQHALFWMWERTWRSAGFTAPPRPGDDPPAVVPPLSLAEFRKNDGLKGIMQRHAEDLYATAIASGEQARELCEMVFKRLCERDAERRYRRTPPTLPELQDLTGASEDELRAVIAPFIASNAALLSVRAQAGSTDDVIDINHESLIRQWDRLRSWADEEAREVQIFRELVGSAREWESSDRDERHLRTGGQLELIEAFWKRTNPRPAWAKRYRTLNRKRSLADDLPLVQAYVAASKDLQDRARKEKELQRQREIRKTRWTVKAVTFAFVVAVVAGVFVFDALQKRKQQVSNTVAQIGSMVGNENPIDALLLAEAAIAENLPLTDELQDFLGSLVSEFRLETELRGHDFTTLAYSPTRNDLLIGDDQGGVQIWKEGAPKPSPVAIHPDQTRDQKWFRWGPDGDLVFLGNAYRRGPAAVYKIETTTEEDGSESTSLRRHFSVDFATRRANFFKDGDTFRLVTFGREEIKLWEWQGASGQPTNSLEVTKGSWRSDATFSSDGRHLAIKSGRDVAVYDVAKLRDLDTSATSAELDFGDTRGKLAFHPDPDHPNVLVTGTEDGVIRLQRLGEDKDIREMEPGDQIQTMAISPDGRWIATSGQNGVIWLSPGSVDGDGASAKIARLSGASEIEELSFSANSEQLASVSKDGVIRIWSVKSRMDEPTAEFARSDWRREIDELKPKLISTGEETAIEPTLDPTLKCLVSPRTPECS